MSSAVMHHEKRPSNKVKKARRFSKAAESHRALSATTTMPPQRILPWRVTSGILWFQRTPFAVLVMPNCRILMAKVSRSLLRTSRSKWRELNSNRILRFDDPRQFVRVSFGSLRFPDTSIRVTAEKGLFLNGIQYRFYHHSSSQLREISCFLRQANNDHELDNRIYQLGDFARIMIVAKAAKRIGFLLSAAELDYTLAPIYSPARDAIENMRIIYRGQRYVPNRLSN